MVDFNGKTILVTGKWSGMGEGNSHLGATVILSSRHSEIMIGNVKPELHGDGHHVILVDFLKLNIPPQ